MKTRSPALIRQLVLGVEVESQSAERCNERGAEATLVFAADQVAESRLTVSDDAAPSALHRMEQTPVQVKQAE
jgi:hypothetical protein